MTNLGILTLLVLIAAIVVGALVWINKSLKIGPHDIPTPEEEERRRDAGEAEIAALGRRGLAVMPREATAEMIARGQEVLNCSREISVTRFSNRELAIVVWRAMR